MKLYEINATLETLVDDETGEVKDYEAFEALQMEREAKLEGVACWVKNLAAEASAIRAEEKALADRRHVLERKQGRLEQFLTFALDGERFQTARCDVRFRKSQRVEITDMGAAVDWLVANGHDGLVQYAAPSVSKTDLKELLQSGAPVDGAELVDGLSVGVK